MFLFLECWRQLQKPLLREKEAHWRLLVNTQLQDRGLKVEPAPSVSVPCGPN